MVLGTILLNKLRNLAPPRHVLLSLLLGHLAVAGTMSTQEIDLQT